MIYVIANGELNDGVREQFIAAAKDNLPKVRAEEGNIMYELNVDFPSGLSKQERCGENFITYIEGWESMDHLMKHLQSAHMAVYRERTKGMMKKMVLNVVTPA